MENIRTNDLYNILKDKPVEIIDIREPYEHQFGHVPGCKNIPMNTLLSNPNNYLNKDESYYIICQSGGRSSVACQYLNSNGYKVINVSGGHSAWPGKLDR